MTTGPATAPASGGFSRAFARNAFFKGAGEAAIRLLSFLFVVLVARRLGDQDFGVFNFGYSFPLLLIVLVDFGFNPLLVRDGARRPEDLPRLFANVFYLKMFLGVLFLAAAFGAAAFAAPQPAMRQAAWVFALYFWFQSFTEFAVSVFHARQEMQLEAAVMTVQKSLLLVLGVLVLYWGGTAVRVAGAYVAAGAVGLGLAVWLLARRGLFHGSWRWDPTGMRYALKEALPLTLTTLFINLYFRIDMTLLALWRSATEVGWYGAAHKCIEVLMVIPAVLVVAAFPGFARLHQEDPERLRRGARTLLRLLLLAGVPLAVGAWWVNEPLMRWVFGAEYVPAAPALAWLATALCLIFINYPLSYLLITGGHQKVNALAAGLAVVVSVGANTLLIPAFGFQGAAVAAVVTEGFLFLAYWAAVRRRMFVLHLGVDVMKILLAAAVMLAPVAALRVRFPALAITAGALTFAGAAWLLRAVTPGDVDLVRRALGRRTRA